MVDTLQQALSATVGVVVSNQVRLFVASSPLIPLTHASAADSDSFYPVFDRVQDILRRLEEMEVVGERIKAMDEIVENLDEQVRIKFELRLEDHLSRYLSLSLSHAQLPTMLIVPFQQCHELFIGRFGKRC